jgi:hypothetical protein
MPTGASVQEVVHSHQHFRQNRHDVDKLSLAGCACLPCTCAIRLHSSCHSIEKSTHSSSIVSTIRCPPPAGTEAQIPASEDVNNYLPANGKATDDEDA